MNLLSKNNTLILAVVTAAIFTVVLYTFWSFHLPHAYHTILTKDKNIEVRVYGPMTVAQMVTSGTRSGAYDVAAKFLKDYFAGANNLNVKMNIQGPLMQQGLVDVGKVPQHFQDFPLNGTWYTEYPLPLSGIKQVIPVPSNRLVKILTYPEQRMVTIHFYGAPTDEKIITHLKQLEKYIEDKKIEVLYNPILSFNGFTSMPNFLKRTDIMFRIVALPDSKKK